MTKQKALVFLSEIDNELSMIKQTVETIVDRLEMLKVKYETEDYSAYIESIALNLQSFYEGIETVFEKVIDLTGEEKPAGSGWHIELIERMTLPIKRLRPEVISFKTAQSIDTFRAFRHRIRHLYGFMVIPENVITIAEEARNVYEDLRNDLVKFMEFAEEITKI